MSHSQSKLILSYFLLFFLQLLFYATVFMHEFLISDAIFIMTMISTVLIFIYLNSNIERVVLFLFITLAFPLLSYPLNEDKSLVYQMISNMTIASDRIQIKDFIYSLYTIMFLFPAITISLKYRAKLFILFLVFFILLFISLLFHNYDGFSFYQVTLDVLYFLGVGSIVLYLRTLDQKKAYTIIYLFINLFKYFVAIIIVDLILSFLHIVPWSTSYRGGVQGVLYAFELPYAFVVGLVAIYLITYVKNPLYKIVLFIFFYFILAQTNIKASYQALFIAILLTNFEIIRRKSKKIISIYFISILVVLFYWNFNDIINMNKSLASRIGTYIAYYVAYTDGNIIWGIMPGYTPFYMETNLQKSIYIYADKIINYLASFQDNISKEMILRLHFYKNAGFLPHNIIFASLASYGIIMIIPFLYYYLILPYRIIKYNFYTRSTECKILVGMLIFVIYLSFSHPYTTLFEVVFIGELCRMVILKKNS